MKNIIMKFLELNILFCSLIRYYYTPSKYRLMGLVGRVFAKGPGDPGSGPVIPKTLKNGKWYLLA